MNPKKIRFGCAFSRFSTSRLTKQQQKRFFSSSKIEQTTTDPIKIRMKKTSPFTQRQRKKIFLALCIKLCIVIAIPLIYLFSSSGLDGNLHELDQGECNPYLFCIKFLFSVENKKTAPFFRPDRRQSCNKFLLHRTMYKIFLTMFQSIDKYHKL